MNSDYQELWDSTFALIPVEEWRPDEIELMKQLCQTYTDLAVIETALDGAPLIVPGSHGGQVANPLLAERRQLRGLILAITKTLKLPSMDELTSEGQPDATVHRIDGETKMTRSESGRVAANARWGNNQ